MATEFDSVICGGNFFRHCLKNRVGGTWLVIRLFRHPILPCLFAYITGLWLANDLWPANHTFCLVVAGSVSTAVFFWSLVKRESSLSLLLLFALLGVLRLLPLAVERDDAYGIVKELAGNAPRVIEGTVSTVTDESAADYQKFVMSDVLISSGATVVRLPGKVAVVVTEEGTTEAKRSRFFVGARLRAAAVIDEVSGFSNFYLPDYRDTAARNRIYATARIPSEKLIERHPDSDSISMEITDALADGRQMFSRLLDRNIPGHEAQMIDALMFNDRKILSEEDHHVFRDSGTMHLLVVSGLHVAIMAYLILALFRSLRLGIRPAWSAVAVVLFLYVWLLGFIAPALRAVLMVLSYSLGRWIGREVDNISALGLGAAIILMIDPMALWDASFILSVMGVFGLVLFAPLFAGWFATRDATLTPSRFGWLRRWLLDALGVLFAATLMLLPLQFFYFQQFNLLSPVANILEAALSVPLLGATLATILVGLIFPAIGPIVGAAAAVIMKSVYLIASFTAAQDWAIMHTARISVPVVIGYYLILLSGYYMVRRDSPEFRMKSAARMCLHSAAAMVLLCAAVAVERFWPHPLRIYFLDVGQGDSTLIQFPSGQTLLVDAGNVTPNLGKLVIEPELKVLGVRPLDNLLATHADGDHIGGMPFLLGHYPVRVFEEGTNHPDGNELIAQIDEALAAHGVEKREVRAGETIQLDKLTRLEVLNPLDAISTSTTADNNQGVVLRLTYGKFTALLMADAEQPVEERLVAQGIGPCDVLKVGHHGSKTSSIEPFIAAVRPAAGIISCGRKNRYGHPSPGVLARLEAYNVPIYRTDRNGAVLVETDGISYSISTARDVSR